MRKNIFVKLSFIMLGFGLFVGIIFPFIVVMLGGSPENIYKFSFILVCLLAGLVVGIVNIFFAKLFIQRKLSKLSSYMNLVNESLSSTSVFESDIENSIGKCDVSIDSTDAIGKSTRAFNSLLSTLYLQFSKQKKIRDFSNLLNSNLEIELIAEKALRQLIDNVSAKGGALAIEQKGQLSIMSSYRMINIEKILESHIPWETLKTSQRQYLHIPDEVQIDSLLATYRPSHTLIEPIIYKDVILGIIILSNDTAFNNSDLEYIEILINNLAMALKNALAHEQLARLAAKDPLTNLYNRRYGLKRLKEEYSRSLRNDIPLGIAMIDIDHFKKVNDTYGHLVGDKVLCEMTDAMHNTLREGDIAIRYGGEEFLVLLPGAAEKDCIILAERIRRVLEELIIVHTKQHIKITVSIGITSFPQCIISSIEDLIGYADKALYTAKQNGRNRVVYLSK